MKDSEGLSGGLADRVGKLATMLSITGLAKKSRAATPREITSTVATCMCSVGAWADIHFGLAKHSAAGTQAL